MDDPFENCSLDELPSAVIVAWAAHAARATGTNGEEHAIVALTLQFQPAPGMLAQQTFMLHKDDAADLRRLLKNPTPQPKEDQS